MKAIALKRLSLKCELKSEGSLTGKGEKASERRTKGLIQRVVIMELGMRPLSSYHRRVKILNTNSFSRDLHWSSDSAKSNAEIVISKF